MSGRLATMSALGDPDQQLIRKATWESILDSAARAAQIPPVDGAKSPLDECVARMAWRALHGYNSAGLHDMTLIPHPVALFHATAATAAISRLMLAGPPRDDDGDFPPLDAEERQFVTEHLGQVTELARIEALVLTDPVHDPRGVQEPREAPLLVALRTAYRGANFAHAIHLGQMAVSLWPPPTARRHMLLAAVYFQHPVPVPLKPPRRPRPRARVR